MRRPRSRVTGLAIGCAVAVAWLAPAAAQAAGAAPAASAAPAVTISPLKGTPDASPSTQISFLGVPAGAISKVSVRGTRSGGHGGTLEPYSTGTGASFVPLRAFTVGEQVTVTATVTVSHHAQSVGTSFTIGSFVPLPPPRPVRTPPAPAAGAIANFLTLPTLHPPTVSVTAPAADPALGDIFLTPVNGASQAGPMIVDPAGRLVWFAPEPPGMQATNLRVQQYLGQPVLTYWEGRVVIGHGAGAGVIMNSSYQPIAAVKAGNGLAMDLHEFLLEPHGVALITVYQPVRWNLSSVGGLADGIIDDCAVQEIDVKTGLVMFEWHALGHIPLSNSHTKAQRFSTAVWDFFHINSIFREPNQNLLISSRSTWAVYQIGHTHGEVLWTLGGRHSTFTLGPNVRFAYQHDASMLADGSIEIFDNEDTPQVGPASRAIDVALDYEKHTATLLHAWVDPQQPVLSASQGDVQQLGNADRLLGWGQIGLISEVSSATGALTLQMRLPPPVESYRAFRFPWVASPISQPVVVGSHAAGSATTTVDASWNGATAALSWQVLAGASPTTLVAVGTPVASTGFETVIDAATTAPYVAVSAVGADGSVLSTSAPVAVSTPAA